MVGLPISSDSTKYLGLMEAAEELREMSFEVLGSKAGL